MENNNNNLQSLSVERKEVTREMVDSFLNEDIVKFVFFDKQYSDISSDKTIDEIHKFNSKYRGNRYVRIPLEIVKKEDDKYPSSIDICGLGKPQGYVVVSKVDLWDKYKEMRKANREEKILFGEKLCKERLEKLNNLLVGSVYEVTGNLEDGKIAFNEVVIGSDVQNFTSFTTVMDKYTQNGYSVLN